MLAECVYIDKFARWRVDAGSVGWRGSPVMRDGDFVYCQDPVAQCDIKSPLEEDRGVEIDRPGQGFSPLQRRPW